MFENKKYYPIERNPLKKGIFLHVKSNSLLHHKDISNYNYEHRIKLNPSGEYRTMDIRNQIPTNKIEDNYTKSKMVYKNKNIKDANEKAIFQSKIEFHLEKQKHQNLLRRDKNIKKTCDIKNKELKEILKNKKNKLKNDLIQIIKDALKFSENNDPLKSMIPNYIIEIVEQLQKEQKKEELTLPKNKKKSVRQKNEFLYLLGVDVDNLSADNVNIDFDKSWNYILKLSKGRKIEDILRYKVVNEIMSIAEKKSSKKAKEVYDKLDMYKKYLAKKKLEEIRRKKMEEEEERKKEEEEERKKKESKVNIKSLSQPKLLNFNKNNEKINSYNGRKKIPKSGSSDISKSAKNLIKLNAYNDVNKIIDFIDKSKRNSQSKICKEHFLNIQSTKSMNNSLQKMLQKNEIKYS